MAADTPDGQDAGKPRGEGRIRLPYERPRVLYREPLEIIAAVCTDQDSKPDTIQCMLGPSQS
jgi:hypothetical protein